MKINHKFKSNLIIIIITITIIGAYHCHIQNGLEKLFCETYFDYNNIKRPLNKCKNKGNGQMTICIGMPSGHAETVTIVSSLLYLYKFIPLWLCLLLIFIISIQRVVTNMHSILQILGGILLGVIYVNIYKYFNLSIFSFLIIFCFGLILVLLCIYKLDKEIYEPIPNWVSPEMIPLIKKKQNSPLYIKIGTIYINSIIQHRTFITWKQLEKYLDILIEQIENSGENYDGVVGIKTGGAILSDYLSFKLGLPNYKVKLSRSEYNCNKTPKNVINDMIQKNILKNFGEFTVCEGIDENLVGKKVILIDELVSSGKTMTETYNYLKENKQVHSIYPTSVAFYKNFYKGNLHINYLITGSIMVWPWGYDN